EVPAICNNNTYKDVDNVRSCITLACDKNANVMNYFRTNRTCRILHCALNYKMWEGNFHHHVINLRRRNKVATYILTSKVTIPSTSDPQWTIKTAENVKDITNEPFSPGPDSRTNEVSTIIKITVDTNENRQKQKNSDITIETTIIVTAGSFIGSVVVIAIILRYRMRKWTVRYIPGIFLQIIQITDPRLFNQIDS
ncbi:unnamed protein product, partial [Owenia fusiformis]